MKRWAKITIAATVGVLGLGFAAVHHLKGPAGATVDYGGSIESRTIPEFASADQASWANGAPVMLAAAKGSPVILEIWSPT